MGRITEVAINDRRALNQTLIYTARAPVQARRAPGVVLRGLRSALRMSQSQLSRRSGVPRAHIARVEAGLVDVQVSTLARLFDAMFCDLLVLPLARKRPSDAIVERRLERPDHYRWRIWDE